MNSHIPVFNALFAIRKFDLIVEFGTGIFSTPLFSENANKVITIEQQNKEWTEKCKTVSKKTNIEYLYLDNRPAIDSMFSSLPKNVDMIFIDGIDREYCQQKAVNYTGIIAIHDSQIWWRTGKMQFNAGKDWMAWSNMGDPATTILSKDLDLLYDVNAKFNKGKFIYD